MRMQNQWLAEAMRKPAAERRASNPFATRWVRPGVVRYCFPEGMDAQMLIGQLKDHYWRGAIVGPHGSGKSTLLFELNSLIEQQGISVRRIALCDGQRKLPANFFQQVQRDSGMDSTPVANVGLHPAVLLVVDGYEQLGWWARRRLLTFSRARRCGLLITAHCDSAIGQIPILFRIAPDLVTVQHLVHNVLPPHGGAILADDVAIAFAAHHGNVRETLFALYDLFEKRRRGSPCVDAVRL
jgi:hypothetical protein